MGMVPGTWYVDRYQVDASCRGKEGLTYVIISINKSNGKNRSYLGACCETPDLSERESRGGQTLIVDIYGGFVLDARNRPSEPNPMPVLTRTRTRCQCGVCWDAVLGKTLSWLGRRGYCELGKTLG